MRIDRSVRDDRFRHLGVYGMSKIDEFYGTLEQSIDDSAERHLREIKRMTDNAMQQLFGKIAWESRSIGQKRRFENQRKFNGGNHGQIK